MNNIDQQMQKWAPKLRDDLRIPASDSNNLYTAVFAEVGALPLMNRAELAATSPIRLTERIDEIVLFQRWMDIVNSQTHRDAAVVRAQVITQNYVCFVYLGENWFKALRKLMPSTSTTRKISRFLTDNPVRAFRNALAHGNWQYHADFAGDFDGLVYWARKGDGDDEPLTRFEVSSSDLEFWQALARCTAYASLHACSDVSG